MLFPYYDLSEQVFATISKGSQQSPHPPISQTISKYITKRLQVMGNYIGILPMGVPDPMNAIPHLFNMSFSFIQPSSLQNKSKSSFQNWFLQIQNQIKDSTMILPTNGFLTLTIGPSQIFSMIPPTPAVIYGLQTAEQCWDQISKQLVLNIQSAIPIASFPATSILGGSGFITFSKFL